MTGPHPDDDDDVIDRITAGVPAESDQERTARAPYERLVARLRMFDGDAPPDGWEERAAARFDKARADARRRRWMFAGAGLAIAAAAAVLVMWRARSDGPAAAPRIAVVVSSASGEVRRGAPTLGDVLRVRAPEGGAPVEIRLYRDSTLVARCPGDATCVDGGPTQLSYTLTVAGRYQVITLHGRGPFPPPHPGGLDADVLAARRDGADVARPPSIWVSP